MLYHYGTLDKASPRPLRRQAELAIYLLTPGFSQAYHRHALAVSDTTVAKYLAWSRDLVAGDASVSDRVSANVASITAEDGLAFAQLRGSAHLPWWSRLAIAEFRHRLNNTVEVARLFNCSRRTVQLALKTLPSSYDFLTGERRLSATQKAPAGMWSKRS